MKCAIVLGVLALVAISNGQLPGGEGGDNLLTSAAAASSSGQMGNMIGGDQGNMNLVDLLSRARMQMGGGMFRGMTGKTGQWDNMGDGMFRGMSGNTGQWDNMADLMRGVMGGRTRWGMGNMGQGWGMNNMGFNRGMGQMFGMGRGMDRDWGMGQGFGLGNMMGQGSGLGNLLRFSMLSRGKFDFFVSLQAYCFTRRF